MSETAGDPTAGDVRPGERRRFQAEVVYADLRSQILGGQLRAGQRLVEERLAEQFNTSRTPVREALRRLEGDGYLVRGPGGSLQPAMPDLESMSDYYDVRAVIEELSVRRAVAVGDQQALAAVRGQWYGLQVEFENGALAAGPDFVYTDESFHVGIVSATGNQPMLRILSDINRSIRNLRIQDFTTQDRIAATISEHLEIIDTILIGDVEAAAAFMSAHVQRSAMIVRERAAAAADRMQDEAAAGGAELTPPSS